MAGVEHVPYRGNSAIMADLFAGRVAMMYDGPPTQLGNIQSGKVRTPAITRPSVRADGRYVPGYAIPFWTAIFAPAGTPKEIVERIAAETNKAVKHPEVCAATARSASSASDRARRSSTDFGASSSTTCHNAPCHGAS